MQEPFKAGALALALALGFAPAALLPVLAAAAAAAPATVKIDNFVFGPETRGLPAPARDLIGVHNTLSIPMQPGSRSLNLSHAVAVVVFEAWRQLGFAGRAVVRQTAETSG